VVCAACLKHVFGEKGATRRRILRIIAGGLPVAGLLLAWLIFYGVGRALMMIPASVHDGTAWGK